jgi:hypothetical protein
MTLVFYITVIFGTFSVLAFIAEHLDRREKRRSRRAFLTLERDLRLYEDETWARRADLMAATLTENPAI